MNQSRPADVFEKSLTQAGKRIGTILPSSVLLICFLGQASYTDYFASLSDAGIIALVAGVGALAGFDLLNQKPSRHWRIAQAILMHLFVIFAIGFLMPLPSPYLLCVILLAGFTYLNFGQRALLGSTAATFASLLAIFVGRYGWQVPDLLGLFLATYAIMLVLTYYSVFFMRVAMKELLAVSDDSRQALAGQKQVESLINNISDGVIAVDKDFKVTVYNAAALDVLDLNTDIKGKSLLQFFEPRSEDLQPVDAEELLQAVTIPTINRDLKLTYKDGSSINLFLGIAPVYLGFGKADNNGFTLVMRDITREKSLEEERDEFISVVSHELRTPIAISEGNISNAEFIVNKTGDIEAVKNALKEAHSQVLFLADMINDLSTLSRAERGILPVEPEVINIPELCQELVNSYTPEAAAKGLTLRLELDPAAADMHSVKLYVREVIQNFVTNAIKYTDSGEVVIGVRPGDGITHFSVRDTGIGISKGDQERVFDKFFRSEDYRTRQHNGTGLGLYVTMKLARLLHAEMQLDSELNKGSTFTISFPELQQNVAATELPETETDLS